LEEGHAPTSCANRARSTLPPETTATIFVWPRRAISGEIAAATAQETAAVGIDWAFAPTLAVPRDKRWGRTYEGFAEDPTLVR